MYRKAHGITFNGDERIHGRTVIVTGANCGIGYQTAGMLAARGRCITSYIDNV